jgi:murein DD-endopeptidase MepM/ murein hydrolase activator NlpD
LPQVGLHLWVLTALLTIALFANIQTAHADSGNTPDQPNAGHPLFQDLGQDPERSAGENLANLDLIPSAKLQDRQWAEAAQAGRITEYTVQAGDTLWSIAAAHNLTVDSLRWANPELRRNPDVLSQGQKLRIPPLNGALHDVQPGDTVDSIAAAWNVAPADIRNYWPNHLPGNRQPTPGSVVIVPHGTRNVDLPAPTPVAGYAFAWPISGWITQGYHAQHHALDIAGPYGASVYASRAGRVIYAGWNPQGYGYLIKIQHADGFVTYYSHLKGQWVQVGQWVNQGDLVGAVGSTGNSTGPHVHFEIRKNGAWVNPLNYLPPK